MINPRLPFIRSFIVRLLSTFVVAADRVQLRWPERRPIAPGMHAFLHPDQDVDGRVTPLFERLCPATMANQSDYLKRRSV
jgi:hypothetical protein